MKRQPGELVRLTYTSTATVLAGDYLRTPTGRTYLVDQIRPARRRLTHAIDAIVMEDDFALQEHDVVHPLHWNRGGHR